MLSRKVCMIGDFSVGKTSLVARFVHSAFSEAYLTTVGVKVDTKVVATESGGDLKLVVWDIASTDALQAIDRTYVLGARGFLLVVDGTRASTLVTARTLKRQVCEVLGQVPFIVAANKADLETEWEVDMAELTELAGDADRVIQTSAKTGDGVERAFTALAQAVAGH